MVRLLSGSGKAVCSQPKPRQRGRYKSDIEDNVILQQIKSELSWKIALGSLFVIIPYERFCVGWFLLTKVTFCPYIWLGLPSAGCSNAAFSVGHAPHGHSPNPCFDWPSLEAEQAACWQQGQRGLPASFRVCCLQSTLNTKSSDHQNAKCLLVSARVRVSLLCRKAATQALAKVRFWVAATSSGTEIILPASTLAIKPVSMLPSWHLFLSAIVRNR